MTYIPPKNIICPEEVFPKHIIKAHTDSNGKINERIWRLMNSRIIWTAVQLRNRYKSPIIINDYLWGGSNQHRGYRDPISLINKDYFFKTGEIIAEWSSFTSQHCLSNALDCIFKKILAEEVRQDIIKNSKLDIFKFINGIEKEVSWVHIDSRNHSGKSRFIIF